MSRSRSQSVGRGSLFSILGTLLSRVSGLVREIAFGYVFGASAVFDAFVVAFRLPNSLRAFIAEGAFTVALVPQIRQQRESSEDAENLFVGHVSSTWSLVLGLLSILCWLGAPYWIQLMPGLATDGDLPLAISLARIMSGYVFLIGLYGLALGVSQARLKFFGPAVAPVALNFMLIAVCAVAIIAGIQKNIAIYWLSYGVLVGGVLQLAVCVPAFLHHKFSLSFSLAAWRDLGRVLRVAAPASIGVGAYQVQVIGLTAIATTLGAGAVSIFFYADRLVQLPLALLGTALGATALPFLTDARLQNSRSFSDLFIVVRTAALLMAMPAVLVTVAFGDWIVALIYGYGTFDSAQSSTVATVLRIAILGVPAAIVNKIYNAGHYAHGDTKRPVIVTIIGAIVLISVGPFLVERTGMVGLASTLAIVPWLQLVVHVVTLRKRLVATHILAISQSQFRSMIIVVSLAVISAVSYALPSISAKVITVVTIVVYWPILQWALREIGGLQGLIRFRSQGIEAINE